MKNYLILSIVCSVLINAACSNTQDLSARKDNTVKEQINIQDITPEDQAIIDKYKNLVNSLNLSDRESTDRSRRRILPEISQIKNKYEREKIQMNIYLSLSMYQEAYDLNNKQLAENPSTQKQFVKCELTKSLNLAQDLIKSCHEKLAQDIHEELDNSSKDDPLYIYGEWSYLLVMYQAGHDEYKQKMQDFIAATKDETMKTRFKDSYDLVTQ